MSYYAFAQDAVSVGLGALATIALFASVPASAGDAPQEKVSYSDLDLTSQAGQDTLDQRIRGAVKRVCGPAGPSAGDYLQNRACKRAAYVSAHNQVRVAIARAGERKASATSLALATTRPGSR